MKKYIGCSGYYYPARKGEFYPAHLPTSDRLPYYAQHFNAVEINSTYYKFPTIQSLKKWYAMTPDDFAFSLKVPGIITHKKKLSHIEDDLARFISLVEEGLHHKARCLLFQLPPSFRCSSEHLQRVLAVPKVSSLIYVFEFRDRSWRMADVQQAIAAAGIVFCSVSHPVLPEELLAGSKQYIRLHGKPELYKSGYKKEELESIVQHVHAAKPREVYIFCNNTRFGRALDDAQVLQGLL